MKDVFRKDSLQILYAEKSALLDQYIKQNKLTFSLIEKKQNEIYKYQDIIDKKNEEIIDLSKKSNNKILYGVGGIAVGIVIGVIIAN